MQLTYAHIKNFKSIKDIEIDFTPFLNKTVLISGENRDEVGLDSNKSGKTCFVESFIWVLFGSQLIRGNSEEIVRHGEKEATGILRFDNGIEIERKLKGKTQYFYYRINGKDKAESNADSQELFLSDIGLAKKNSTLIKNGIYLNNNTDTLLTATPAERLKIFSEWFSLEKYDSAIKLTRERGTLYQAELEDLEQIKFNKEELVNLVSELAELETKVDPTQESLEELRDKQAAFKQQYQYKVEFKNIVSDIAQYKKDKQEIEEAKEKIDNIDIDKLKSELKKVKENNENKSIKKKELVSEINSLQNQIVSPLYCPKCGAALVKLSNTLSEVSVQVINETKQQVENKSKELSNISFEDTSSIERQIKIFEQLERTADRTLPDISNKLARGNELKQLLSAQVQDYTEEIRSKETELSNINKQIGSLNIKIELLKQTEIKYRETREKLKDLKENIRLCELWAGKGIKTGLFHEIKALILSKNVLNLESITNLLLKDKFGIDSSISLKITSRGIELLREGKFSIDTVSGGEGARVAFAIALALKQIYSSSLELLIADEYFGALDQTGMETVKEVLDSFSGTKFLISHVPTQSDYTINLVKENGVTRWIN
jgi:DNA repair exonuclease SbcCD ATPase subunit